MSLGPSFRSRLKGKGKRGRFVLRCPGCGKKMRSDKPGNQILGILCPKCWAKAPAPYPLGATSRDEPPSS